MKVAIFPGLLMLALGGFFLGFSGSVDDAHITYWSAWILAERGEILNYNLERVEQSSALLQVMVLALLHKLTGVEMVALAHITTILVALATIMLVARVAKVYMPTLSGFPPLFLCTAPFFLYWAFGGMEGPWLGLLLLLAALSWHGHLSGHANSMALLLTGLAIQLARPEMLLVANAASIVVMLLRLCMPRHFDWRISACVHLVLLQAVIAACILITRFLYFGDLWPQPVAAKTGAGFFANAIAGVQYAWQSVRHPGMAVAAVLAAAGLVFSMKKSLVATPLPVMGVLASVYCAFVITSGGDWMAGGRFWVPVIPLFAILAAQPLSALPYRAGRVFVQCVIVVGHVTFLWHLALTESNGVPLWKQSRLVAEDASQDYSFFEQHGREHLHDIPTLAFARPLVQEILDRRPDKVVSIMAGQAGMVIYHLARTWPGHLSVVDRNGLTDRTFTGCSLAAPLLRTRNGLGMGYEWMVANKLGIADQCGYNMPDMIFDIDAGWNRHNLAALEKSGYVIVYYQKGHVVEEDLLLPLRRIGAGQYIAVSEPVYKLLGYPAPILRNFAANP